MESLNHNGQCHWHCHDLDHGALARQEIKTQIICLALYCCYLLFTQTCTFSYCFMDRIPFICVYVICSFNGFTPSTFLQVFAPTFSLLRISLSVTPSPHIDQAKHVILVFRCLFGVSDYLITTCRRMTKSL